MPSAAICADVLAQECDFFSIGTNDLTQYTLAVDRGNERVAHLYQPLHPAVLALMARTVDAARRAGIPVSVCGEMAREPEYIPFFLGIGIRSLSVNAHALPSVQQTIMGLGIAGVEKHARELLEADSVKATRQIIDDYIGVA